MISWKQLVVETSSVRLRLSNIAIIFSLQFWTNLSQIPSKCGAPGGLNFHTIFFCANSVSILASSHSSRNALNSFTAPTKIVWLSLMMVLGLPRLAIKLVTAAVHDWPSNDWASSMCAALVVRQFKRQNYLFNYCLKNFLSMGRK